MAVFSISHREDLVATIDIGSSSVTGALVSYRTENDKKIPTVIFTQTVEMTIPEDINFERFIAEMLRALGLVSQGIVTSKLGVPRKIHCFLASPWYSSETHLLSLKKDTPFVFTQKISQNLISSEVASFQERQLARYKEAGDKVSIIENHIVHAVLNGYPSKDPYGKKVSEVELSLFLSIASDRVLNDILNTLRKVFHSRHVEFHSFLFAGFTVIRDLLVSESNFLFVDIGGEVTDIALVKNGELGGSISFPSGRNYVIRQLSSKLHIPLGEAQSLFSLYQDNKLEKELYTKASVVLEEVRKDWLTYFQNSLVSITEDILIPETVVLTVDLDIAAWFMETMRKEAFSQYTMTEKNFTIIPLNQSLLLPFVTIKTKSSINPFIAIESLAVTRV